MFKQTDFLTSAQRCKISLGFAVFIGAGHAPLVTREDLETELLGGQKLQGVLTSKEVQQVLVARGWQLEFPMFTMIHKIVNGEAPTSDITRYKTCAPQQEQTKSVSMCRL